MVPKCKECKFFKIITPETWSFKKNNYYECMKITAFNGLFNQRISAKDIRTSPKWCPRRNRELK